MRILVKAIAGSHLFGTNTPTSDLDYKGIYIPSKKDLLLGKVALTINLKRDKQFGEKNTKDDIDIELYSFHKFIQMLHEGQTAAIELVWTPLGMLLEYDPLWLDFRLIAQKFLMHKKVTSFVGYCKTQADKYGIKGSRMSAVKNAILVLENLKELVGETTKLSEIWPRLQIDLKNMIHIEFGSQDTIHGTIPYMEICDRKFQDNQRINYCIDSLRKIYDSYGARAKQAETNQGIDWKALSHAYRVCCQAIELLSTHHLTLPLKENDLLIVKNIKLGLISYNDFAPLLEAKLAEVIKWESESTLPEDYDIDWTENYVMNVYEKFIFYDDYQNKKNNNNFSILKTFEINKKE